jgi:hypothetical protein
MTQLETKIRIKIRTAERDIAAACLKLRDVLIAGANSSVIRAELSDLHRRVESGNAELSEIAASEDRARGERMSEMAATLADEAEAKIKATVDRLRPPAKTATAELEDHHVSN